MSGAGIRNALASTASFLRRNALLLTPSLLLALLFVPVVGVTWRALAAPFGRDQGIFQYTAWALEKGQKAYTDFQEVNGPLAHLVHLIFLKVGGADERVFRILDTVVSGASFLAVGLALPGLEADAVQRLPRAQRWALRILWTATAWALLSVHRLKFTWWDISQREGFYNLLLLPAIAVQLVAQAPARSGAMQPRRSRVRDTAFLIAGALATLPSFGKPTCALYPVVLASAILLDRDAKYAKGRAIAAYAAGCVLTTVGFALFASRYGDLGRWVTYVVVESPRFYKYVMRQTIEWMYYAFGNNGILLPAFVSIVIGALLVWRRVLPSRFWVVVFFLFASVATFFAQRKGFRYHVYPIVGGMYLLWLVALQSLASRVVRHGKVGAAFLTIGVAAVAVILPGKELWDSWSVQEQPKVAQVDPARPRDFYMHFQTVDFFPWDQRRAARFLAETTPDDGTVQTYGLDPYVLFLARRLSASPFIYAFDLGDDSILASGPPQADADWLRATFSRNQSAMLARLQKAPPAAFVFFDRMPLSYPADTEADFVGRCRETADWMLPRYRFTHRFGAIRVWLRADLHDRWLAAGSPIPSDS